MSNAIMQLCAYGDKNIVLSSRNIYSLGFNEYQMKLVSDIKKFDEKNIVQNPSVNNYYDDKSYLECANNCTNNFPIENIDLKDDYNDDNNELKHNSDKNLNQYVYECFVEKCSDMLKFINISIELDENLIEEQDIDNIWSSILNSYLEIYSCDTFYDKEIKKFIDGYNAFFICQIPLYMSSQKFKSNKCIFKFANETFISGNYFVGMCVGYKLKIAFDNIGKYIKKINILGILNFMDTHERRILALCINYILFKQVQYVKNIPIKNVLVYHNNNYVIRAKINMIGFIKELFFNIPHELVCLIKKINIMLYNFVDKYNNPAIISFIPSDNTNEFRLVNTNDIHNVYFGGLNYIGLSNSLNFEPEHVKNQIKTTMNDYVEFIFDKEIEENTCLIKKISIGALCSNEIITCQCRSKLKYNCNTGELNDELNLDEIDMIEKYSNHKNNKILVNNILSEFYCKYDSVFSDAPQNMFAKEEINSDDYEYSQKLVNKYVYG